jgi:glycosyltransferase involved in cell wall biosynthesis
VIVGIAMVKDEADIIGYTLEHFREQGIDRVIVADNLSTDETPEILATFVPWCIPIRDGEFAYYQSRKMSAIAAQAYELGATWLLPFDADERVQGDLLLGEFFPALPPTVGIVEIQGWDYLPRHDDDPDEPNPYKRLSYRRPIPQPVPKIAFRAAPNASLHMGNHDVNGIDGDRILGLRLRHLQYRSCEQMTRKLRNGRVVMEATDLSAMYCAHWRAGGALTDEQLAAMWDELCNEPAVYDPC